MTVIYRYRSGCINCGHLWSSTVGASTNTFGMSEVQAREHLATFWRDHNPWSIRGAYDSPYVCPRCGSLDIDYVNFQYAYEAADDANLFLQRSTEMYPPEAVANELLESVELEMAQVEAADLTEAQKIEAYSVLNREREEIDAALSRYLDSYSKYEDVIFYYKFHYAKDLESIQDHYGSGEIPFSTFTDQRHKSFSVGYDAYLRVDDKALFLQCLFFEALINQALHSLGIRPTGDEPCIFGSSRVVGILAAAGFLIDPYFILLASSRWSDADDLADQKFEQVCHLFKREICRVCFGLHHAARASVIPEDVCGELVGLEPDIERMMKSGYFLSRPALAKPQKLQTWMQILDRVFA